jgi:hypothetical protein
MKQGHDKPSAFAICTKTFQDADKPMYVGESETQKLHLFSESINLEGNKVSGVAIHPKRIFHPEEDMTHVYLKEELELAAPTLTGKPFGIDHLYPLPPPNVITKSWYDAKENGVAFEGLVDDKIAGDIRNKQFKGLSIELNWLKPGGKVEFVDGVAPRNFELTSCHFLKTFPPGDKDAFIKLWNGIMEQLVQGSPLPLDQRVDALERRLQELVTKEGASMKEEDLARIVEAAVQNALKENHAKEPNTASKSSGEEPNPKESEELVSVRKKLVEAESQLLEAQKQAKETEKAWTEKYGNLKEGFRVTIPPPHIYGAWSQGPKRMIQEQLRVLRESQS